MDTAKKQEILPSVRLQRERVGVNPVVDGGEIVESGCRSASLIATYPERALYFLNTGRMRGDENPWMVVSTGVDTSPE